MRACTCCCHSSCASDIFYFAEQGATSTELLGKDHFLPKGHRRNFSHVFPTQERPVLMALSCLIYIHRPVLKNAEACGGGSPSDWKQLLKYGGRRPPAWLSFHYSLHLQGMVFQACFYLHSARLNCLSLERLALKKSVLTDIEFRDQ